MNKKLHFPWKLVIIIVLIAGIFYGIKSYWNGLLDPVSPKNTSEKIFVVRKGESVSQIADHLKKEGLIKSPLAFNYLAKNSALSSQIQAGDFKLSPSMSSEEILKELTVGAVDKWVTLLEGWRVEEMAEEISSKLKIENSKFIKVAKEGYMFPDTYLFRVDSTPEEIAQIMRDNFRKKYSSELINIINRLGLTAGQGVILASIVEREARSDEARRMAASILLKRLNIGMGLNADATIQYALGYQASEKSWWKRHLTREDLKTDSPYNTYLYKGLPPAPISNPSLSALQAVARADPSTPYLYYYHDSQGRSHYAKTLDEHNENVARYP